MKQEKNRTLFKKWFFRGMEILFLIAFLFFLSLGYSFYKVPNKLLLEYNHQRNIGINFKRGEIFAGEKIQGIITAREDNLGILAVRFETYGRKNTDLFIFRLKEKNENGWYYVREYESRLFPSYPLFPFGFPIIANSKGKAYIFEIESLRGKIGNAVAIGENEPTIVSKYKFSKEVLLRNRNDLVSFIMQKSLEVIRSTPFQRLFSMLLFFSFAIFVFVDIFLLHREKMNLDISSKTAYVKMKERNVKEWFYKRLRMILSVILAKKNIITILLIGSIIRLMIPRTADYSQGFLWQFFSPFSIQEILVSLQKQGFPLLLDIGSFFLLYKFAEKNGKSGLKTGTFFFLHPVTLMLSGVYGIQMNVGMLLLLAFAFIFLQKKKIISILLLIIVFAIFISPVYGIDSEPVGLRAALLSVCQECAKFSFITPLLYTFTFFISFGLFFLSFPEKNIARFFLLLILCFLSFTPIFLLSYLWLPIAFGSLFRTKWYYFYSVVSFLSFFTKSIIVVFPFSPITINYVWFSLFLWFCAEVKETIPVITKTSSRILKKIDEFSQGKSYNL